MLLHDKGITEAGCAASWHRRAGTSLRDAYCSRPMIPIYIFYSMFGFQRTGDSALGSRRPADTRIFARRHRRPDHPQRRGPPAPGRPLPCSWPRPTPPASPTTPPSASSSATSSETACAGCTANPHRERTPTSSTTSPSTTNPSPSPPSPTDVDVEGILAGMHRTRRRQRTGGPASDPGLRHRRAVGARGTTHARALGAVDADVWSVTSWNSCVAEALATDEWNYLHPDETATNPLRHRPTRGTAKAR